jgi:enoyl-CoA hydratase/carnithine racemase
MSQADNCCHAGFSRRRRHDNDSPSGYPVCNGLPWSSVKWEQRVNSNPNSIAYEKGKYGFVFARRGITMESCSSFFLPRLIGHSNASYLVSTGAVFPPTSKHFGDLFNETLPEAAQVLPRALELASDIAQNVSPSASYLNRALMWRDTGSAEAAHLVESHTIQHMFGAP